MNSYADLHIHTLYSDGTFTPREVVELAHKQGFLAIAITDHDCIDGIEPSIAHAAKYGMEIIPAVELTAEEEDFEVHMLGYFIDWQAEWFTEKLKEIRTARVNRTYEMIAKLKGIGINIDPRKVFKISGPGSVGRLHLASALYSGGWTSSIGEAFRKYIGNNAPCYVRKFKLALKEAIDVIIRLGGVPVLAHPHTLGRDDLIPVLTKWGLRGIEVYHTGHSANVTSHYEKLALKNNLLLTGGSDCHGMGKSSVLLGRLKVP
ncbi:MAG: PHP domain-containing protein, partial [Candidatus Omnitrophota bacterium]|nr:PHP domain-containing protein [Candidatus Omnitrophota bacterium]